jgi:hypothetical protein
MSNQMKEIDWSKAPEGAQGYMPKSIIWAEGWWKDICGKRFFCHAGQDEWKETHANAFGLHGFVYRPDSAQGAAWTGEGLPPVGTVCECQDESFKWKPGTIVYVGQGDGAMVAVMQADSGILIGEKGEFRPLRTPEQIAAEEREKAIAEMRAALPDWAAPENICPMLYDAGYRKVTP